MPEYTPPPDFWDKIFGKKPPKKWGDLHRAIAAGKAWFEEKLTIGQVNGIRKMYPYSVTGVIIYREKVGTGPGGVEYFNVVVIPPQAVPDDKARSIYGSVEAKQKYIKMLRDWMRRQGYV